MSAFAYQTVGQAFASLVSYCYNTAWQAPTNLTGLSMTWTAAVGATPGYFTLTSTTPVVSNTFSAAESTGAPTLRLASLVREVEFQLEGRVNAADTSSPRATLSDFNSQLTTVLVAALKQCVNGSNTAVSQSTIALTGNSATTQRTLICGVGILSSNFDVAVVLNPVTNDHFATLAQACTFPNCPVQYVNQMAPTPVAPTTVTVGSPLDMDVAINSGQAIFSIISKTTTILP
jgi:hypothetical protein